MRARSPGLQSPFRCDSLCGYFCVLLSDFQPLGNYCRPGTPSRPLCLDTQGSISFCSCIARISMVLDCCSWSCPGIKHRSPLTSDHPNYTMLPMGTSYYSANHYFWSLHLSSSAHNAWTNLDQETDIIVHYSQVYHLHHKLWFLCLKHFPSTLWLGCSEVYIKIQ